MADQHREDKKPKRTQFDENGVPTDRTPEVWAAQLAQMQVEFEMQRLTSLAGAWRVRPRENVYARMRAELKARIKGWEFEFRLESYYELLADPETRHLAKDAWPKRKARCRDG